MPDLHQKTAAAVAELRAIAEAGTGGTWQRATATSRHITSPDLPLWSIAEADPDNAALIVAAVNTLRRAIPAWEKTLRRHRPIVVGPDPLCVECPTDHIDDCRELRDIARAVGVLEEE